MGETVNRSAFPYHKIRIMKSYGKLSRHAFYNKWRLAAVATFTALSSFGFVASQPGQADALQVVVGVAAFVAVWIAVYLWVSKK